MTEHVEAPDPDRLATDPELAEAARAGDEAAFIRLYDRHAPMAWRTGLALTGDPTEAGTTLTEGFARSFTALRTGRTTPDTTFRGLLLMSVRNTAIDRRRDRADGTVAPERFTYVVDGTAQIVAASFAPLPERWRSALWLTEVEGLRASQIAQVVGLAPQAAATLSARARDGFGEQYLRAHAARTENRNCGRSLTRLGAYVSGMLGASDTDKIERHLRLCEACTERRDQLEEIGQSLRSLILPLPDALADEARAAWAAAVVDPSRSRTGLSSTAEKVLAGASAFAAAVGVLGATMFGAVDDAGSDQRAAAPIVTETPGGESGTSVTPLQLPAPTEIDDSSAGAVGDSFGDSARRGTAGSSGGDGGTVVGASGPAGGAAPAGIGDDANGARTDGAPPAVNPESQPAAKAGTSVGGQDVAIEVGEEPGVTVGPLGAGSEPTPDEDSTLSVDGQLEPLAPVVEPIDEPLDQTVDAVTGGLG